MTKSVRIRVPEPLWARITCDAEEYYGYKDQEIHYIQHLVAGGPGNPFKNPPKQGVAQRGEIKKTSSRKGKRFLFHDRPTGLTNWVYFSDSEDDNKNIYSIYFYFCENRGYLTDDMYGPLFVNKDTEKTDELVELAKCMVIERDAYIAKANVPRETPAKTAEEIAEDAALEAYNKERRDMIERGGMKHEDIEE